MTGQEAIDELKRIGPVYDAAVRLTRADLRNADAPAHTLNLADKLAAAVKTAESEGLPAATGGQLDTGSWWAGTDWAALTLE